MMGEVLSRAGKAALRAILPALFVLGYGLLNAKDLNSVKLDATTFAVAVGIVIFTTLSSIVPQLSWRNYVPEAYAKYLDAFTQTFVGTFAALAVGFLGAPNWNEWRSAVTAILIGAGSAAVRALQALLTPGEPVADPRREPKLKPRSALARG